MQKRFFASPRSSCWGTRPDRIRLSACLSAPLSGRILVLNAAKGGVASAWMLREMARKEMAPLALLLNDANPVMAQGAAFAQLPLIDRFDTDITAAIASGDHLRVDPAQGLVQILR